MVAWTVFRRNKTDFVVLKPLISPTYHYPAVPADYCDIVFISMVVKFHRLNYFPRLYISHAKPTLWLDCGFRLYIHSVNTLPKMIDCLNKYTINLIN